MSIFIVFPTHISSQSTYFVNKNVAAKAAHAAFSSDMYEPCGLIDSATRALIEKHYGSTFTPLYQHATSPLTFYGYKELMQDTTQDTTQDTAASAQADTLPATAVQSANKAGDSGIHTSNRATTGASAAAVCTKSAAVIDLTEVSELSKDDAKGTETDSVSAAPVAGSKRRREERELQAVEQKL